jgi:hypothetical protein
VIGFKKRFLYYACKAYSGQIGRGDDYPRLNQVIFKYTGLSVEEVAALRQPM